MRRKWRLCSRTAELFSLLSTLCRHGLSERLNQWREERAGIERIGMLPYSRLIDDGGAFSTLLRGRPTLH
jgi:hypothetical protein